MARNQFIQSRSFWLSSLKFSSMHLFTIAVGCLSLFPMANYLRTQIRDGGFVWQGRPGHQLRPGFNTKVHTVANLDGGKTDNGFGHEISNRAATCKTLVSPARNRSSSLSLINESPTRSFSFFSPTSMNKESFLVFFQTNRSISRIGIPVSCKTSNANQKHQTKT